VSIELSASELSDLRMKQLEQEEAQRRAWPSDGLNLSADKQAIHESLKRQREQRTKRVKSHLP